MPSSCRVLTCAGACSNKQRSYSKFQISVNRILAKCKIGVAMEDPRRWSVAYTKHVKHKREVYQDGLLEHQSSRHKVLLYDEWDKLLESRFVKKDDVIKSGETLTLDSYLVDIGELCGGHKPTSTVNSQEKKGNVSRLLGPPSPETTARHPKV